ncbi:MAG TPA: DUF4384 domain-containing protein [Pirellulales bacterium]|nr:DUF4384 domain-containing protein [Pirellulales bacterium]
MARSVCCCALMLVGVLQTRAAEPVYRDLLRRYVGQHKDSSNAGTPPGFSTSIERAIGLEYSVMVHKDGTDQPVDPEQHPFHAGDQMRIRIQPLNDLYVYVFFEDGQGCRRCLLPSDKNSPRLAKHDQPIELPSDGSVFEFEAEARQETLTLIATQQPDDDLATLCDVVCKKREDRLTPEERARQLEFKARNQRSVAAIQDRLQKAVAFRGRLSGQALGRLSAAMTQSGAEDALIEERTGDNQSSTLVVLFSKAATPPKLAVSIPLRATGTGASRAP